MATLKVEYFSATLINKLEATDIVLPLSEQAEADLRALLPEQDDYIYLTIKDDVNFETVRVKNAGGYLVADRGVEGTQAVTHPFGSCVVSVSPTVVATIKDLICTHQCCDTPCPVEPVELGGSSIPSGKVGVAWAGHIVFMGTAPISAGLGSAPSWLRAEMTNNLLNLSGTPDAAGEFTFSVAATNGNGTVVFTMPFSVTVEN